MVGVFVEEAAEVVSDEARGVECGLLEEGFLDGGRSQGNGVALLAKERVLVGEVSNAVLLAQRPHAEHEDAGHEEELEEALLPLRHVGHQTERLTSRRRGSAVGGRHRRDWDRTSGRLGESVEPNEKPTAPKGLTQTEKTTRCQWAVRLGHG